MRRVIRALVAVAFAAFVTFGACGQSGTIAPYMPIRWIDVNGYKWNRLLPQAYRWNALMGTAIFQPAAGIGTEIYPHPSYFDEYSRCSWVHRNVHGCVNDNRDIHARDDFDRQREAELYLHELGHTIAKGKGHTSGRGVMADEEIGGEPTNCLTMDDYWYMCDYLQDIGWGAYCGTPSPEC